MNIKLEVQDYNCGNTKLEIRQYNEPSTIILDFFNPKIVYVDDYHEFSLMEKYYSYLIPQIKVEELGFCEDQCKYVGIVYINDPGQDKIDQLRKDYINDFKI